MNPKITAILGGKYEVVGVKPGLVATSIGQVDLSKITEDVAEQLVKAKSSYIRRAQTKAPDTAKTDKAPQERKNDK